MSSKSKMMVVSGPYSTGTCCRYFHPSPPQKSVSKERVFEGISLDTPGASGGRVMNTSRIQLCQTCFEKEKAM